MNIVIPIKQVPETSNVKMDEETGTMKRDGVESIINPLDLYAIETGIQLKEEYGGKITVITMGPPSADKALKEAIAMGCDDGILLSGREFAGSDTWATSYALSEAIKEIGDYDLILAGERATDGDTGQVGPGIASWLDLTLSTYTSKVVDVNLVDEEVDYTTTEQDSIIVERMVEDGYEKLQLPLPALLTVVKEISFPRLPTLRGKQRSRKIEIPQWNLGNLDLDEDYLGLQGSPTRVVNIDHPKVTRGGTVIDVREDGNVEAAVAKLIDYLKSKELV
ncbi:electron transfer flavoprotein beta subunit [Halanaerobium saccharolyticum]|uniref:Electron transfer flavoprotein small subunit n=1 Tax=Halanaerobium saccharolyticum TaxID=43595 RepID=A0A2T5RLQ0_9FIRM|nr:MULTISPECIES: electron transfer flavoprotein subunit beta/FixA family protein [Halanaerobium]PTW00186.1 electron transfer flavoprotein beta subunit [Halanaerobium saccharolyticum]PUU92335.1 MAG: electron transfer flavoprotein subunit alpha/beta-like protein [Halanaerobium sp.]